MTRGCLIQPEEHIYPQVEEKRPTTVADLLLYLLAGMGLFFFFSPLLLLDTELGTLTDSALRFLLNVIFLGGTTLVFGIYRKKITWQQLGLQLHRWRFRFLWIAFVLGLAINPLRGLLGLIVESIFGGGVDALEVRTEVLLSGGFTWPSFLVTLIGAGILVPIAEELYFRGLLHNWFAERYRYWPRVLLSSAIFGLGHFDSIGVVVSSFIMGIVITIAYERTKTLWLPIAIHALTNSGSIMLLYLSMALSEYFL
jgi:uncharacterized protein